MRDLVLIGRLAAIGGALLFFIPLEPGITRVIVQSIGFGLLAGAFAAWSRVWQKRRAGKR